MGQGNPQDRIRFHVRRLKKRNLRRPLPSFTNLRYFRASMRLMVRRAHAVQQVALQVADTLFRSSPQSIVSLKLPQDVSEYGEVEMAMGQDAKDFDDGPLVLSTEPLTNLRYLRLPDKYRGYHADQICPFLEQSPRLES
ncbi:hypothetical protein KI688_003640 [Linnemannia hyalina]|uniref:Uncharacterized protein n=1 Tax=Linnemannia hyalina TaxID=64524 RepID=A0A9P8BQJ2_9FUNG|nr:hypothetical protein KI688_003640 [Linnemannia hyalina]